MPFISGGGGGGASYTAPITREQLHGANVSIANNDFGLLTWTVSSGPSTLLDLTAPTAPVVVTTGVYALTIEVDCVNTMTASGYFGVELDVDNDGEDPTLLNESRPQLVGDTSNVQLTMGVSYYLPAASVIEVTVFNHDGAASRNFKLQQAVLQRLS